MYTCTVIILPFFKVQLQQHSRTIATLSDRLEKSIKDSQQMTKLNEDLQLQLRTVTEKLGIIY